MRPFYGYGIIQVMQDFYLDVGNPPTELYKEFDKIMIIGDTQKWILANESKIVAAPYGHQIQNFLLERALYSLLEIRISYLTEVHMMI